MMDGATTSEVLFSATHTLLTRTSGYTGQEFFASLTGAMRELFGVHMTIVGCLDTEEPALCRRVTAFRGNDCVEDCGFDLSPSTYDEILRRDVLWVERDVRRRFPEDPLFDDLEAQSFIGLSLRNMQGGRVGVLAAMGERVLEVPPNFERVLEPFAFRAAAELERIVADEKLRCSEQWHRQIVTTCIEGIAIIDVNDALTKVNDQLAAMFGYEPHEMVGKSMYSLMDPDGRELAERYMTRRRRGVMDQHEFRFRRKDGTELWTLISASPWLSPTGKYLGAVAVVTDLTERRALDRRIRQTQRLESLGVLAGGIAHDFNNLLVGIMGNAGLLEMQLPEGSSQRSVVDDILRASSNAADLIAQLLTYAGRGSMKIEPIDVNRVLDELMGVLAGVVSARAEIQWTPATELPRIVGDVSSLRQIAMNLLINASDAIGEKHGYIRVRTALVDTDEADDGRVLRDGHGLEGEYVLIEVEDTGCGMDSKTVEQIFDPFFSTKRTGRGLGLATVHGILRSHQGSIVVSSEPGKGTTFRVYLPTLRDLGQSRSGPEKTPEVRLGGGTVLVVDDDAFARGAARRALEAHGFTVETARDGLEALELFRQRAGDIAVVLLDLKLPGLWGDRVLAQIREIRAATPVVLTSGSMAALDEEERLEARPDAFLAKPWHPTELLSSIESALARHR